MLGGWALALEDMLLLPAEHERMVRLLDLNKDNRYCKHLFQNEIICTQFMLSRTQSFNSSAISTPKLTVQETMAPDENTSLIMDPRLVQ
uniref:Uncharacterized protein n=1 Tax=Arion vulgaris TaxID=1028688 RepID=A0A0B6YYH3_9EUPU